MWCRACYRLPGAGAHECPVGPVAGGELSESQRFQVGEARDILGTWDMANPGGVGRETVLADQVRALLVIVDQAFPAGAEPESEDDGPLCAGCGELVGPGPSEIEHGGLLCRQCAAEAARAAGTED